MYETEDTVVAGCSPEEAFRHIATEFFLNHSRWDPAVVKMTKSTPGAVRAGTLGQEHRRVAGRELVSDVAVTEYEPVRRFAFESTSGPLRERVVWDLQPTPEGTHIRTTLRFIPIARPMKIVFPLMRRVISRNVRRNTDRFRTALAESCRSPDRGVGI